MCGEERNPARNRALKTLRQGLQRCGCVWLTVSLTVLKTLRGCREMVDSFEDPQVL